MVKGFISPIPKCDTSDPRDPLSYTGITLALSVYKPYVSILNKCLTKWAEDNKLLTDGQKSIRQDRSYQDHLTTLSALIDTFKQLCDICGFYEKNFNLQVLQMASFCER